MDIFGILWAASLLFFIVGPSLAGIAFRKKKITLVQALIAGLLALTISAALIWSLIVFSV
ncbi:MAG: hypothetical protein AAB417_02485 [Patescibacteria group bacterium]